MSEEIHFARNDTPLTCGTMESESSPWSRLMT